MFDQMCKAFYWRLSPNLSGYQKGHSCCTAFFKMTQDWRVSLDRREAAAVVAVDLSKAFDSICHPLLLVKLKAYGFKDDALGLMAAYLLGRRQRVQVSGVYSQWRAINTGVPQGPLRGPLFFNLFVSDPNYFVFNTSLRLYADDTTEYASDPFPTVLQFVINSDLSVVSSWFESNYLKTDAAKMQVVATGPSIWIWISSQ